MTERDELVERVVAAISRALKDGEQLEGAARAAIAECEKGRPDQIKWFGELMAVMHHDGGHYLAEHGPEKAAKAALNNWYALEAQCATMREALKEYCHSCL